MVDIIADFDVETRGGFLPGTGGFLCGVGGFIMTGHTDIDTVSGSDEIEILSLYESDEIEAVFAAEAP